MKSVHRVVRWLAVVLPPGWAVGLAVIFCVTVLGLYLFTLRLGAEEELRKLRMLNHAAVVSMTVGYAMFRGMAFHPAARAEYLGWLALTPWQFPKPLPVGPVLVVAQDWIVLGVFEAFLLDAPLEFRLLILALFLFVIASCWTYWMWATGSRSSAYEVAYALGATLWIASVSGWAALIFLMATDIHAIRRFGQSFAGFPWGMHASVRPSYWIKVLGKSMKFTNLGWAFDVLSPHRETELPLRDRLALSGLAGWWSFAIFSHTIEQLAPLLIMTIVAGAFGCCMTQLQRFTWSHASPISPLGRLLTGRWIILSYDVVFLPIVYFVSMVYATMLLEKYIPGSWRWGVPLMLTLYLVLINVACPEINRWRLTSKARLRWSAYTKPKGEFEQL